MTAPALRTIARTYLPMMRMIGARVVQALEDDRFRVADSRMLLGAADRRATVHLIRGGFVRVDQETRQLSYTRAGQAALMLQPVGSLSASDIAVLLRVEQADETLLYPGRRVNRALARLGREGLCRFDGAAYRWQLGARGVTALAAFRFLHESE